jgi:phosphatidate cytidylyltransferase
VRRLLLKQRVVTGLLLLALILPAIMVSHPWPWPVLSLLFCAAACWEWGRMVTSPKSALRSAAVVLLFGLGVLGLEPRLQLQLSLGFTLAASFFWLFLAPLRLVRLDARSGSWPLAVILLLAAWLALVQIHRLSPLALFVAMAIVWVADIGAYFVGRAVGRRKLAPAISPGKSWEGVWGGLFLVVVIGLTSAAAPALSSTLPAQMVGQWGPVLAAVVLAGLAAFSVVGDLHESLLKRQAQVKDSSSLLPGHGGVLDRIDALLPTMPLAYLLHYVLTHGFSLP